MKEEDVEKFITQLDKITIDMCVYPSKQTFDCRVDYFNNIRRELSDSTN